MTTDIKELVKYLRDYAPAIGEDCTPTVEKRVNEAADALEKLDRMGRQDHERAEGTFAQLVAAEAERDRLAGEVGALQERNIKMRAFLAETSTEAENRLRAERDRLKAALGALEAVRSDLPEKVSEQWLYEGVRHWHRNCDWDEPRDGSPLDRGDGATVAKLINMIPRKALGGDAS